MSLVKPSKEHINEIRKTIAYNKMREVFLESDIIDFNDLYQKINRKIRVDNKFDNLFSFLRGIDLTNLFKDTKINIAFDCYFFKGNMAWISEEDNHFRYFSKNFNGQINSFDLIDIAKPYYGINSDIEILNILLKNFNITDMSSFWRKGQLGKYRQNIAILEKINKIKKPYPSFYKLVYKYKDLLILLNKVGMKNLMGQEYSFDRESLFFASGNYLAKELDVSRSKVTKLINFFTLIGLIKKVPVTQIPEVLLNKSMEIAKEKNSKDIVNYYTITSLEEVKFMDDNCRIILDTPLRYSNISKSNIDKYLGESYSSKVYH